MTNSKIVQLAKNPTTKALSKGQKLFNKLIRKIDEERAQLKELQETISLYQMTHANEYLPLKKAFDQHRADMMFLLDSQYSNKLFNKTDRKKLSEFILDHVGELLLNKEAPPELKELFNRHSDVDFDTQSDEVKTEIKNMIGDLFGAGMMDDVDIDINDPYSFLQSMVEQAQHKFEHEEELQQNANSNKKKTAKQLAKEARLEQEEKDISQSIRLVYRKLASALHPDRELDQSERARKTDLMQRVNVAYADRNLLQLLELQLEIEQIDETMVSTLSADRLKHYNQILTDQLVELEMEIEQTGFVFQLRFKMNGKGKLMPKWLIPDLLQDIVGMKQDIDQIKLDLQEFKESKAIKAMLKNYSLQKTVRRDVDMFDDISF